MRLGFRSQESLCVLCAEINCSPQKTGIFQASRRCILERFRLICHRPRNICDAGSLVEHLSGFLFTQLGGEAASEGFAVEFSLFEVSQGGFALWVLEACASSRDEDIGGDAAFVDEASEGCVIAGDGHFEAGAISEIDDGLDGAFAEGHGAHDDGAAVILECAGDDLSGGCGALVDEDDDGELAPGVLFVRHLAFDFVGIAAFGADDQAAFDEEVGEADGLVEESTWVVA